VREEARNARWSTLTGNIADTKRVEDAWRKNGGELISLLRRRPALHLHRQRVSLQFCPPIRRSRKTMKLCSPPRRSTDDRRPPASARPGKMPAPDFDPGCVPVFPMRTCANSRI